MKKRTAFIGALLSLMPLSQPLIFKTIVSLSTVGLIISEIQDVKAEDAEIYNTKGMKNHYENDHYGAISNYSKAIQMAPKVGEYYYNRGLSKNKIKDYKGAISDFTKAIELKPQFADAYRDRGLSHAELGDYYAAISDGNKAIKYNPNDVKAYFNLGLDKQAIGDLKGACTAWRKASSLGDEQAVKVLRDYCTTSKHQNWVEPLSGNKRILRTQL